MERGAEESPEADVCVYYSRVGTFHLRTHKQRILNEGSPQVRSWAGSCSIGDEPCGAVAQLRMSLKNTYIDVCAILLK